MKQISITVDAFKDNQVINTVDVELLALKVTDALKVFSFLYTVIKEKPDGYKITIGIIR